MTANFADWQAIYEAKGRYCRLLDTKDWEAWADCLTDDVAVESPNGKDTIHGRDAVVKWVRGNIETAKTAHQVHAPEMTFAADGQSVEVIWAMNDRVVWAEDKRDIIPFAGHTGFGHYHDRFVKGADGKWRLAALALRYIHMDMYPLT
jgi:ketosteroid isomerase-like protein